MTAGSSGGGWVGGTTAPILLSVTSYGYPTEPDHLYGPYMSAGAKALYKLVRGGKKKKKGLVRAAWPRRRRAYGACGSRS